MPDSLPLFEPRPLSRSGDPATSKEAASGAAKRAVADRERCLAVLRDGAALTSAEVAKCAGIERHAAARRLPELLDAGLVVKGEVRVCAVNGTRAAVWKIVAQGRLAV